MSYVRKFTRREKILSWLIAHLDNWQEKIAQKQWAKLDAEKWPRGWLGVEGKKTPTPDDNEPS